MSDVQRNFRRHADPDRPIGPKARTALALAVRNKDAAGVRAALAAGARVNRPDNDGVTPLAEAVRSSTPEIITLLLSRDSSAVNAPFEKQSLLTLAISARGNDDLLLPVLKTLVGAGAQANPPPAEEGNALTVAVLARRCDAAEFLLLAGADPLGKADQSGFSPLFHAAALGDIPMLELLAAQGALADLNARHGPDKLTPLHAAVSAGKRDAVQWLLRKGAFANIPDSRALTPLHAAAQRDDSAMITLLVEEGRADIDKTGNACEYTALHTAIFEEGNAALRRLVALGGDPLKRDHDGRTPLQMAAWKGNLSALRLLLEEVKEDPDPRTAMQARVDALYEAVFYDYAPVAFYLLDKGVDLNMPTSHGNYILIAAVRGCGSGLVEELLQAGADPNVMDKNGANPLLVAAQRDFKGLAALLLRYKANPSVSDGYCTPLHVTAEKGRYEMAELLLSAGANPCLKDAFGRTPLEFARQKGQAGLLPLLEKGEQDYIHNQKIFLKPPALKGP